MCLDKVVSKVNMPGQAVASTHIKSAAPDDTKTVFYVFFFGQLELHCRTVTVDVAFV